MIEHDLMHDHTIPHAGRRLINLLGAAAPVAVPAAGMAVITSALTPLDPLGAKRMRLWSCNANVAASAAADANLLVVQRIQMAIRPMVSGVVTVPNAVLAIDNSYVGAYLSNVMSVVGVMQIPFRDFMLSDWRSVVPNITGFGFETRALVRNVDAANPRNVAMPGGVAIYELFPD